MKNIKRSLLNISILTIFIFPLTSYASWWNPITWFEEDSQSKITQEEVREIVKKVEVPVEVIKNVPFDNPVLLDKIKNLNEEITILTEENGNLKSNSSKKDSLNNLAQEALDKLIEEKKDLEKTNKNLTESLNESQSQKKEFVGIIRDYEGMVDQLLANIALYETYLGTGLSSYATPSYSLPSSPTPVTTGCPTGYFDKYGDGVCYNF